MATALENHHPWDVRGMVVVGVVGKWSNVSIA